MTNLKTRITHLTSSTQTPHKVLGEKGGYCQGNCSKSFAQRLGKGFWSDLKWLKPHDITKCRIFNSSKYSENLGNTKESLCFRTGVRADNFKRVTHVSDVLMGLHKVLQTLPRAKARAGPPWPSKPKGITTQTAFQDNRQNQDTTLRAQTRPQLHHCHLTWMRQEDNCTAELKLHKVMLLGGPARTSMDMKHGSIHPTQGTGSKTLQCWFLHCSSWTFATLQPRKFQASSNTLWYWLRKSWLSGFQAVYKWNWEGCGYSHWQLKHLLPFLSHPDPNLPMAEKYQMTQKELFSWHEGKKNLWWMSGRPL